MISGLHSLICREAGRGRRRKPAAGRPRYIAHPAAWWPPETVADHLEGCRTGRGPDGAWKPWAELTEAERWSWYWEFSVTETGIVVGGGPTVPTFVP